MLSESTPCLGVIASLCIEGAAARDVRHLPQSSGAIFRYHDATVTSTLFSDAIVDPYPPDMHRYCMEGRCFLYRGHCGEDADRYSCTLWYTFDAAMPLRRLAVAGRRQSVSIALAHLSLTSGTDVLARLSTLAYDASNDLPPTCYVRQGCPNDRREEARSSRPAFTRENPRITQTGIRRSGPFAPPTSRQLDNQPSVGLDTTMVHIRNAVYPAGVAGGMTPVTVRVHMSDVKEIASSQSYAHVVITNCTGNPSPYPLTPRLGAVQLTNYAALRDEIARRRNQDEADLTIEADSVVLGRFANPCVHISGGSYFGHRLTSNLVPLVRR